MNDFLRSAVLLLFFVSCGLGATEQEKHELSFHLLQDVLYENVSIQRMCCDEVDSLFSGAAMQKVQTGYGGTALWLKIEGVPGKGLLQFSPILDEVTLYTRSLGQQDWQAFRTGDTVSNAEKVIDSPFMVFPLPARVDTNHIYARIIQPTAVSIRAKHWTPAAFLAMQETDKLLKVFLLGCICSIIFYNIVVSILVRDPAFLLNAACISALMVLALYLSGYGVFYLWARWYYLSNTFFVLSVWLALMSGGAFLFYFIRTPEKPSVPHWPIFFAPVLATLALLVLMVLKAPYWWMNGIVLGSTVLFFLCTSPVIFVRAYAGERKPRIILVPYFFAMLPGLVLMSLNKIGGINPLGLGDNTLELTLAMEAVLFSLALAARIRASEDERKEADRMLLKLREGNSARVLAAQDKERKRLAKELHDGVGQEMLLLVSGLRLIAKENEASMIGSRLKDIVHKSAGVMNNLRRVSQDMHPASIEHIGLIGTIQGLIVQFNHANEIDFSSDLLIDDRVISQKVQLHLVRIVQECLSDAAKHSKARHCHIAMTTQNDKLHLSVKDDGKGLDRRQVENHPHFGLGLTSISERVRSMGGEWDMSNDPTGGLITSILIPLVSVSNA